MSHLPNFFRTAKPRRFHYTPLYYDEKKEELERRIRQIENEMGVEHGKAYVPGIKKGQMRKTFGKDRQRLEKQSTFRLLIIVALLLLIAWYLFFK